MDDLDAFEKRLNGEAPAKSAARKPTAHVHQRAKPVHAKKGSEYVKAAVKPKLQKDDDEGFSLNVDKDADIKAVSDLDKFDDGYLSD